MLLQYLSYVMCNGHPNTGGAKARPPSAAGRAPTGTAKAGGEREVRTQGRRPVRGGRRRGREATGERRWGEAADAAALGLPLRRWTPPRGSRRRAEDGDERRRCAARSRRCVGLMGH